MRAFHRLAIAVSLFSGVIDRPAIAQDGSVVEEFRQKAGHAVYELFLCYTRMVDTGPGRQQPNGCDWAEYKGRNFRSWGRTYRFDFPGDGTIRVVEDSFQTTWLVGRPEGTSIDSIRWECPKYKWEGGKNRLVGYERAWVDMNDELSDFVWTCGTTDPAAFTSAKRQYSLLRRK